MKKWIYHTHKKCKTNIQSQIGFKIVHRTIKYSQKAWLKSYNDMNTELRKSTKTDFEKNFFKLMNNVVFGKC